MGKASCPWHALLEFPLAAPPRCHSCWPMPVNGGQGDHLSDPCAPREPKRLRETLCSVEVCWVCSEVPLLPCSWLGRAEGLAITRPDRAHAPSSRNWQPSLPCTLACSARVLLSERKAGSRAARMDEQDEWWMGTESEAEAWRDQTSKSTEAHAWRQNKGQVEGTKKALKQTNKKWTRNIGFLIFFSSCWNINTGKLLGCFEEAPFTTLIQTHPFNSRTSRSCSETTDTAPPGTGPSPLQCVPQPPNCKGAAHRFFYSAKRGPEAFLNSPGYDFAIQRGFLHAHFVTVLG